MIERHAWIPALVLAVSAGCRSGAGVDFRFESGGAHHIEGYGAWTVLVESGRRLTASHDVRGDVRAYEAATLSAADAEELRAGIDAVPWAELGAVDRALVPGEVVLSFTVDRRTYEVPSGDLGGKLGDLVDLLERLVAEYADPPERPVLR